jgi:hypothetical protein
MLERPMCSSLRDVLGPEIIKLIRFLSLTPQEFAQHVANTDMLTNEEKVAIFSYLCGGKCKIPGTISCRTDNRDVPLKLIPIDFS